MLAGFSTINTDGRASGHAKLYHEKHGQYGSGPNCDVSKKLDQGSAQAHFSIVLLMQGASLRYENASPMVRGARRRVSV